MLSGGVNTVSSTSARMREQVKHFYCEAKMKIKDISGMTFGLLTVLDRAENNKHNQWMCRCLCACGNITNVDKSALTAGRRKSCGCMFDLTGKTFGQLTVLMQVENGTGNRVQYLVRCTCGKEKKSLALVLTSGNAVSCGCKRVGKPLSHGRSYTREYTIWGGMVKRCINPNTKHYDRYGGRGILICERWLKFENFFSDMGESNGMTIERINNDGNYEPSNCKWVPMKTQARNRSNNHIIVFNGESHCIAVWAERIGLTTNAMKCRIYRGWTIERALTQEKRL